MSKQAKHSARTRDRQRRSDSRAAGRSERRPARKLLTQRGIVFILILFGLLFSSVYPMKRYLAVRASIESLQQEEVRLDREAAALAGKKQDLLSDDAVEALARERLGMVKVGEVPFVTIEPGASSKPVVRPPVIEQTSQSAGRPSIWSRVWGSLKRATRSLR